MDSRPVAGKPSDNWDAFDEMLTARLRAAQSGEARPGATTPLGGLDIGLEQVRRDHTLEPLSCPRREMHNAMPCPLCEETQGATYVIFSKLNRRGFLPRSHGKLSHIHTEAKRVFAETLNAMYHSLDVSSSEFARRGNWEAASVDIWIAGVLIPPRTFIDLVVEAYEEKHGPLGEHARTRLLTLYIEAHEANQSDKA
ncbi:hypothetical protein AB0L10_29085 [Streptomyces flaveolus]|uniref:hypothetical protein n=1 Tax=Streptomyces flaveolus TaxID=67297 RepID=UPI00342FD77C